MLIFENEFIAMYAYDDHKLFHFRWLPSTFYMSEEQYKQILEKYVELARKHNSERLLADNVGMKFVIVPEMQTWSDELISSVAIELGIKRIAIIQPQDFFALFSVELAIEEMVDNPFQVHFFDDQEVAIRWLGLNEMPEGLGLLAK